MMMLVPIIAATTTIIYQVSARSMQLESAAMRSLAADARRDDFLRRVREDAATARNATVERSEGTVVLTLDGCRSTSRHAFEPAAETQPADVSRGHTAAESATIQYRVAGSRVTRIERPDGQSGAYQLALDRSTLDFNVEEIGGMPRMVWISFIPQGEQRSELRCRETAVVRIGRGGVR
jgi:hypothetical protein